MLIPMERIEKAIYSLRGQKVMLDRNLAELYGVETRVLNQAVRRNIERFPEDFMFTLTREEIMRISQTVISSAIDGRGDLKYSKSVTAPACSIPPSTTRRGLVPLFRLDFKTGKSYNSYRL